MQWLDQQLKRCECVCVCVCMCAEQIFGKKQTAGAGSLHVPMLSDRQITRLTQTGVGHVLIHRS